MVREKPIREQLKTLSNEELRKMLAKCEYVISRGKANISDYETFVLCQKELMRRTWN